jgi:hypothetical protein
MPLEHIDRKPHCFVPSARRSSLDSLVVPLTMAADEVITTMADFHESGGRWRHYEPTTREPRRGNNALARDTGYSLWLSHALGRLYVITHAADAYDDDYPPIMKHEPGHEPTTLDTVGVPLEFGRPQIVLLGRGLNQAAQEPGTDRLEVVSGYTNVQEFGLQVFDALAADIGNVAVTMLRLLDDTGQHGQPRERA